MIKIIVTIKQTDEEYINIHCVVQQENATQFERETADEIEETINDMREDSDDYKE